jgi:hypothetical protein
MKRYIITITQTESRSYVLEADSEEAAKAQAEAWAEEKSGDCPEGALSYGFDFDSETVAVEA